MEQSEIRRIANRLGRYSLFFRTIFDLSSIKFDDNMPTAAIEFSRQSGKPLGMRIGRQFWDELNDEERDFVIAHELCHVIFDHCKRFRNFGLKLKNQHVCNCGMDVSINEMLVRQFGFRRQALVHEKLLGGCWIDSFWPNEDVPAGKSADWYIQKLIDEGKCQTKVVGVKGGAGSGNPFDDHGWMEDDFDEIIDLDELVAKGEAKDFIEKLNGEQHEKELGGQKRGAGDGSGTWRDVYEIPPPKKRKWETIIRRWLRKADGETLGFHERWGDTPPRYSMLDSGKTMLPFEKLCLGNKKEKRKLNILLALDTSGSCAHLGPRFFRAAQTIPTDRFNIDLIAWDDVVTKMSLKDQRIRMGGGTNYQIVEDYCLQQERYPDLVFTITDLYMGKITPKYPERHIFFATPQYNENDLPDGSKLYKLEDFE